MPTSIVATAQCPEIPAPDGLVKIRIGTRINATGPQNCGIVHSGPDSVTDNHIQHTSIAFIHELRHKPGGKRHVLRNPHTVLFRNLVRRLESDGGTDERKAALELHDTGYRIDVRPAYGGQMRNVEIADHVQRRSLPARERKSRCVGGVLQTDL